MKFGIGICSRLWAALIGAMVIVGSAFAAESDATRQLKSRTAEFDRDIIRVSDNVHTAVGYGVSAVSMIVGSQGIVIIDTGIDVATSKEIRKDFRRLVDKPVKAIILTHGHPDHILGASAFVDTPDVQIWARKGFQHEQRTLEQAGIVIQRRRGVRQAGFALSAEQRINNGIAQAYWPKRKGGVFAGDHQITPTHLVEGRREKLSIAGIDLELVAATGETYDHSLRLVSERARCLFGR